MFDIMDLEDEERNKLLRLDDSQMQVREGSITCTPSNRQQSSAISISIYLSACLSDCQTVCLSCNSDINFLCTCYVAGCGQVL